MRWGDPLEIDVALARVGRTSFALRFVARVGDRVACTAETVYVAVETTGWTKVPVPDVLLTALGPISPR